MFWSSPGSHRPIVSGRTSGWLAKCRQMGRRRIPLLLLRKSRSLRTCSCRRRCSQWLTKSSALGSCKVAAGISVTASPPWAVDRWLLDVARVGVSSSVPKRGNTPGGAGCALRGVHPPPRGARESARGFSVEHRLCIPLRRRNHPAR
eukprot:scaffold763_cov402-Prasinococcus_capsulatus_cf.AAC.21